MFSFYVRRLFKQRYKFSTRKFAEKYNLTIYAVNFFMTGWPLYQNTRKPTAPKYNPFREHFAPSRSEEWTILETESTAIEDITYEGITAITHYRWK